MTGETIVQIVTIIAATIVTVVSLIVKADVNGLKVETSQLQGVVASAHALILQQNAIIQALNKQNTALIEDKAEDGDTKQFKPLNANQHDRSFRRDN